MMIKLMTDATAADYAVSYDNTDADADADATAYADAADATADDLI